MQDATGSTNIRRQRFTVEKSSLPKPEDSPTPPPPLHAEEKRGLGGSNGVVEVIREGGGAVWGCITSSVARLRERRHRDGARERAARAQVGRERMRAARRRGEAREGGAGGAEAHVGARALRPRLGVLVQVHLREVERLDRRGAAHGADARGGHLHAALGARARQLGVRVGVLEDDLEVARHLGEEGREALEDVRVVAGGGAGAVRRGGGAGVLGAARFFRGEGELRRRARPVGVVLRRVDVLAERREGGEVSVGQHGDRVGRGAGAVERGNRGGVGAADHRPVLREGERAHLVVLVPLAVRRQLVARQGVACARPACARGRLAVWRHGLRRERVHPLGDLLHLGAQDHLERALHPDEGVKP
mmetsp:Transcript_1889/g.4458  ORF Transcript_1889/g.4458 Transcript_1889/m.4458 type:complete len:362 (+) Transcript_1889:425-1510(+)